MAENDNKSGDGEITIKTEEASGAKINSGIVNTKSSMDRIKIAPYDGISDFLTWINYFEAISDKNNMSEEWKLMNITDFLDQNIKNFIISTGLYVENYQMLKELLITVFGISRDQRLLEFQRLNLRDTNDLITFYQKKIQLGRSLKICDEEMVEYLNLAVPLEMQNFLKIKDVKTPMDWLTTAKKLQLSDMRGSAQESQQTHLFSTGWRAPGAVNNRHLDTSITSSPNSAHEQNQQFRQRQNQDHRQRNYNRQGSDFRQSQGHFNNEVRNEWFPRNQRYYDVNNRYEVNHSGNHRGGRRNDEQI